MSECLCPAISSYAKECAEKGVMVDWIPEARECGKSNDKIFCISSFFCVHLVLSLLSEVSIAPAARCIKCAVIHAAVRVTTSPRIQSAGKSASKVVIALMDSFSTSPASVFPFANARVSIKDPCSSRVPSTFAPVLNIRIFGNQNLQAFSFWIFHFKF